MKKKQIKEIAGDDKFKWFVVETLFKMESRISKNEVKSGFWGAIGGVSAMALMLGIYYLKKIGV